MPVPMSGGRGTKRKAASMMMNPWKKGKYTPKSTVTSLTAKVNKILSEQERKNYDVSGTVTLAAGAGQIVQLSNVPQGDDATSRDGRKIAKVSSHMRYSMGGGTTTTPSSVPLFRVIVFHDAQSNGLTPVVGDLLTAPTDIRSPLTMDFKERFRVIHDNYSAFGKGDYQFTLSTTGDIYAPCEYFYSFPENLAQSEFGAIGGVPTSGSVFVFLLVERSAAEFKYYHRLRFTDS